MTHSTRLRRLRLLVAAVVAIAATGLTAVAPAGATAASSITTYAGYASTAIDSPTTASVNGFRGGAFSPNGSTFYLTRGTDEKVLAIPSTGGTATTIAQHGYGVVGVAVSPDGTSIYTALRAGGVLKHNADGSGSGSTFGSGFIPNDIAVSPAGKVYVATTAGDIIRWNADGSGQTTIATPAFPAGAISSIAISPDGTTLAWSQSGRIGVMNIDGTGITAIATGIEKAHLSFGPDGLLFAGSNSGSGSQSVVRMTTAGANQTTIASGFSTVQALTVNAVGQVYVQDRTRSDIVVLAPPAPALPASNHVAAGYAGVRIAARAFPAIIGAGEITSVAANADGSAIFAVLGQGSIVRMDREGHDQIWINQADLGTITDIVVSPDGQWVYAALFDPGQIVRFPAAGPSGHQEVIGTYPDGYWPEYLAFSPDGTHIYYTNSFGIERVDVDGTNRTTIATGFTTSGALNSIAVSPDGSTIYVGDLGAVWSISVASGTATALSFVPDFFARVSVLPNGRLLVLEIGNTAETLYELDANLANPVRLADGAAGALQLSTSSTDGRGNIYAASPNSFGDPDGIIVLRSLLPGAPTSVTATGSGSTGGPITVSWTAPTDTGGSAITSYTVTASTGGATCTSSTTSCTIGVAQGLSLGASVSYRVTATNADGTSLPSAWSTPLVEYNNPQGPGIYSASQHNARQVFITWTSPGGGSPPSTAYVLRDPITGAYDYTTYTSCWCAAVFGPFAAGHTYNFDFYATTAFGNGLAAKVGPFNFPGAPTAPTAVTAVSGDRSATVSWTPYPGVYPAITSYTVTASPGGSTCTYTVTDAGSNSCVVPNLALGSTYTFSVVPTSSYSDGAAATSEPLEIGPSVPQPPTNVTGIGHDGYVDVYWDAPDYDGGSAITGYWAQAYTSEGTLIDGAVCSTTATACGITGLTNGVDYKFSVRATNDLGFSDYATLSTTYAPIANVVPDAPTGVSAVAAVGAATVSWTAPGFDGGIPITGYWAQAYTAGGVLIDGAVCSTTDVSCTISGLSPATRYRFSVRATNDVGYSAYATQSSIITTPGFTNVTSALVIRGTAATVNITTTGLPVGARKLKIQSGLLPAGMTFTDNGDGTGRLSGTPTVAGQYFVNLVGGDAPNQITQSFKLYSAIAPSIAVTGQSVPIGTPARIRITSSAAGYRPVLDATGLPAWATFTDNGDGTAVITGTADVAGATTIRVIAHGYPSSRSRIPVVITVGQAPTITSAATVTLAFHGSDTFTVRTSPGFPLTPIAITLQGQLPAGLTLTDNGDGTATISGRPTRRMVRRVTLRATTGSLTSTSSLVITIS